MSTGNTEETELLIELVASVQELGRQVANLVEVVKEMNSDE